MAGVPTLQELQPGGGNGRAKYADTPFSPVVNDLKRRAALRSRGQAVVGVRPTSGRSDDLRSVGSMSTARTAHTARTNVSAASWRSRTSRSQGGGLTGRSISSASTTLTVLQRSKANLQDELFRVSLRLDRCMNRRAMKAKMPGLIENPSGAQERDYNDHLHKLYTTQHARDYQDRWQDHTVMQKKLGPLTAKRHDQTKNASTFKFNQVRNDQVIGIYTGQYKS